jgi:hypothetical protein
MSLARGTAPEPIVPGPVREGLRTDGFHVPEFVPPRPAVLADDARGRDDEIVRHADHLIDELARRSSP